MREEVSCALPAQGSWGLGTRLKRKRRKRERRNGSWRRKEEREGEEDGVKE